MNIFKALLALPILASLAMAETCQITSPLPMPVTLTGCTYSGSLPANSTSYIQNTLSPSTTGQRFSVQDSTITHTFNLGYITGAQCLTTDANGNVSGTGAACGTGVGGGSAFSLAITTGGPNAFTGAAISSSNSTTEILFDSATTRGLKFGGTYYFTLDPSSVTLQANVLGGDVTGTLAAMVVGDDSHSHTGATLSGIDISNDTNLAATAPIILTGDTLSFGNTITSSLTVTGADGLSVTYGITAPTATFNGAGDGQVTFTIMGSTYAVVSASTPIPTVGHLAVWTSTSGTLGDGGTGGAGTPSAPVNSVQYNNAGAFGGSSSFNWSSSSLSVIGQVAVSTLTVVNNAGSSSNTGNPFVNIYEGNVPVAGTRVLASIGTNQQADQIVITDQQPLNLVRYGVNSGGLRVGRVGVNSQIYSDQATTQLMNWWNSGAMEFKTATVANGGKDLIFYPNQIKAVTISTNGVTVVSSMSVTNLNGMSAVFGVMTGTSPTLVGSATGHTQTGQLEVISAGLNSNLLVLSTSTTGTPILTVSTSIALAPTDYLFTVSSAPPASTLAFGVQNNGHLISSGTTPTPTSCGVTPVINGTDNAFTVTPGATATGCTVTFTFPFANNPVCIVKEQTESLVNALTYTHSSTQIVITQTGAAGANYDVICIGQKG